MTWKGLGMWEGGVSTSERPCDLCTLAAPRQLRTAMFRMARNASCAAYVSPVGGSRAAVRGLNLGNPAIWHSVGGRVGRGRQAVDPGSWTGSATPRWAHKLCTPHFLEL